MLFEVKERFKLSDKFLEEFAGKQPEWGPLGYITYKRSYSRPLPEGGSEEFWQTLRRVVEGTYTIQLNHCKKFHLPWNPRKAQKSAQEMYRRMWDFKMLPPGRGLWMMGTDYIYERGSMPLNNCAAVSTINIDTEFAYPFVTLMDMSMMGTGCSFDTKGAGKVKIVYPKRSSSVKVIEDSKEGWTSAVEMVLNAYFGKESLCELDFSLIRPEGAPIKTFGGVAPGPEPLIRCIDELKHVLEKNAGAPITSTTIVDVMNIIGKCVVSGGVRRCLPKGTLVHTSNGLVPIESVAVGTLVKTTDGYRKVVNNFYQGVQELATIYTNEGVIQCTADHRLKLFGGEFVAAKNLTLDSKLLFLCEEEFQKVAAPIYRIEFSGEYAETYDIEVEDNHEFIFNEGFCSHNSAELALGDPNDEEYLDLKNPSNPELNKYRWASNNSIQSTVGMDYSKHAAQTALNGEPGYFWLENAKNYGRMADGFNPKADPFACLTNPCMPAWGEVLTPFGVRTISEIEIGDTIWSGEGWTTVSNKWSTGVKEVWRYTTTHGQVYLTPNHRILQNGEKIEIQDAQTIDSLEGATPPSSEFDPKFVLAGLLLGDGYLKQQEGRKSSYKLLCIGVNDTDYFTDEVGSLIKAKPFDKYAYQTYDDLIESSVLLPVYERVIPQNLMSESSSNILSLLRGLFSANGSYLAKYKRVCLKTTSSEMANQILVLLSSVGIKGYISTNKPRLTEHHNGEYLSRVSYQVQIAADSDKFMESIGFIQKYKMDGWNPKTSVSNKPPKVSWDIQDASYHSTEEVWDITVDNESHTFWYYGFNISNCAEQTLEDGEICCLVETFPSRHETLEDYMKTCKYAYIYAKTVTLVPTHNPRVNQIINRNRRMGISQSGIIEAFQRHGRRVHFEWCDKVYKYLRDLDTEYSCRWLGVPPSIKLTSVKPSGSVSLLPGVTPGIHYAHSEYYYRTIRLDKTSPLVAAVKRAGYRIEESVYGDNTFVVYFPVHEKNFDRAKDEVSIWEQMENVAQMSYYWADNQVSATVTFKPEEADQLPKVLEMYETRLKSISFLPLRDHSYEQAPYQTIDEAEYKKANKMRPLVLGDVHDTDEKFCTNDSCTI